MFASNTIIEVPRAGMTIGSMISGSVYNVTFQNSKMIGGLVGMRFKAVRNLGGVVRDIRFLNLSFESVAVLMSINMVSSYGWIDFTCIVRD